MGNNNHLYTYEIHPGSKRRYSVSDKVIFSNIVKVTVKPPLSKSAKFIGIFKYIFLSSDFLICLRILNWSKVRQEIFSLARNILYLSHTQNILLRNLHYECA